MSTTRVTVHLPAPRRAVCARRGGPADDELGRRMALDRLAALVGA